MLGVCLYSVGCSEAARAYPFGEPHKARILELSRFHVLDEAVRNSESWFLSRAQQALSRTHPQLWAAVAFADPTAGHHGSIYQAVNALYLGTTRRRQAYRDAAGAIHSDRQGRRTLTRAEATARGWIPFPQLPKHRYLLLCGGPLQRHYLRRALRAPVLPYPHPARQITLPLVWDRVLLAGAALVATLDAICLGGRLARRYTRRLGGPRRLPPPAGPGSPSPRSRRRPPAARAAASCAAGALPAG